MSEHLRFQVLSTEKTDDPAAVLVTVLVRKATKVEARVYDAKKAVPSEVVAETIDKPGFAILTFTAGLVVALFLGYALSHF